MFVSFVVFLNSYKNEDWFTSPHSRFVHQDFLKGSSSFPIDHYPRCPLSTVNLQIRQGGKDGRISRSKMKVEVTTLGRVMRNEASMIRRLRNKFQ